MRDETDQMQVLHLLHKTLEHRPLFKLHKNCLPAKPSSKQFFVAKRTEIIENLRMETRRFYLQTDRTHCQHQCSSAFPLVLKQYEGYHHSM